MFRTRQGSTVKLVELLDEATDRARALMVARAEQIGQPVEGDLEGIARAVGIGAVKYADLSTDRARDYRFDWDRMLAFDGNTAPYIQYAHAAGAQYPSPSCAKPVVAGPSRLRRCRSSRPASQPNGTSPSVS